MNATPRTQRASSNRPRLSSGGKASSPTSFAVQSLLDPWAQRNLFPIEVPRLGSFIASGDYLKVGTGDVAQLEFQVRFFDAFSDKLISDASERSQENLRALYESVGVQLKRMQGLHANAEQHLNSIVQAAIERERLTCQWRRGVTNIDGATAPIRVLAALDKGEMISCVITATNAAGVASAESLPVGPIVEAGR